MKQIAVLMRCPGIVYDVDSDGATCRDMKTAHQGRGIRNEDFNAVLDDVVGALLANGIHQDDIDAMAPALLALRADIVTNSAPGLAKPICDGGQGGGG